MFDNLNSITDNCDLKTLFIRILNLYDPFKGLNKKTRVLDCSNFFNWYDIDRRLYDVNQTHNLNGYVKDRIYDIIIFDPPQNRSFLANSVESAKVFYKILHDNGIVIVKTKDYKEDGCKELKGSFDIKTIFASCDFYLFDQIIHKNNKTYNNNPKETNIIHSYFLIFKKKKPS
jgi:hypothetical protein